MEANEEDRKLTSDVCFHSLARVMEQQRASRGSYWTMPLEGAASIL